MYVQLERRSYLLFNVNTLQLSVILIHNVQLEHTLIHFSIWFIKYKDIALKTLFCYLLPTVCWWEISVYEFGNWDALNWWEIYILQIIEWYIGNKVSDSDELPDELSESSKRERASLSVSLGGAASADHW